MPRHQPDPSRLPWRTGFAFATLLAAPLVGFEAPPLKSLTPQGLRIGVALNQAQSDGVDTASLAIVTRHFNSVTAENILKWEAVHPEPDRYEFAAPDRFVSFGQAHNMLIVGHTLVWHQQTPAWVFAGASGQKADRATVLARMRAHITAVVGRYRGRIHAWDVVNEALEEDGTLRRTPWLELLGEDYIAKAFEFAREADPNAELYYNDYNLWKPAKRDGAIALVNRLRTTGVRVDGIGEQAHWGLAEPPIAQIDSAVGALAAGTGVRVALTELDIDVLPREPDMWGADLSRKAAIRATTNIYPDGLPEAQQRQLAQRYAEIFKVVLRHRAQMSRVTFWGVTDAQSWLHDFPIPGRINYPLLWDRQGRPKPALDAVAEILRTGR
jgi:endo-1,4-beta-xylanase